MPQESGPFVIDGVSYETDANGNIFRSAEKRQIPLNAANKALSKKQEALANADAAIAQWTARKTGIQTDINNINTLIAATQ